MAIIRCLNGHYYDDQKSDFCPLCRRAAERKLPDGEEKTVSLTPEGELTERKLRLTEEGVRMLYSPEDEKTAAFFSEEESWHRFLAGWLVCVKGPMRGRDYRVFRGFNRIGRNVDSDICVLDPTISGQAHCAVVYDDRSNQFYLVPGKGTATYLHGGMLQKAEPLTDGERFSLGNSELELTAFCKGEHVWKTI